MRRNWGTLAAVVVAGAVGLATPARAEQMRVDGYFPAVSDEAAALRSIAVVDFSGEDGPLLSLRVADRLREVRIDGQPWLSVLVGRHARGADGALSGTVRTRFVENNISQMRNVCTAYDEYDTCIQRADQNVPCLQVTAYLRPELRLSGGNGQLIWSWSQESSRNAEYCPDLDDRPDFEPSIEAMVDEFAQTIRYQLAPAHEGRNVRVLEGRGDLPRPLRDPYRNAIRLVERDPVAACTAFAALLPQAPSHPQLVFNNALCAERSGQWDLAAEAYGRLADGRGAAREGRDGLARIGQYRRARAQLDRRGG